MTAISRFSASSAGSPGQSSLARRVTDPSITLIATLSPSRPVPCAAAVPAVRHASSPAHHYARTALTS
eukprot:scaffold77466_cov26-Tisochrysis_lutea.AAC.2